MTIEEFVGKLANVKSNETMQNPYENEIPRQNLTLYLRYFVDNPPVCILIGEAPGYKGCALTGIPFTDEYRFTSMGKLDCLPLMNFDERNICGQHRNNPEKENSANVVWNGLVENNFFPLLWNMYPFHPHEEKNLMSNRAPSVAEIAAGNEFVSDLLKTFPTIKHIYVIGKVAQKGLDDKNFIYIRHPAHGGAQECRSGIKKAAEHIMGIAGKNSLSAIRNML